VERSARNKMVDNQREIIRQNDSFRSHTQENHLAHRLDGFLTHDGQQLLIGLIVLDKLNERYSVAKGLAQDPRCRFVSVDQLGKDNRGIAFKVLVELHQVLSLLPQVQLGLEHNGHFLYESGQIEPFEVLDGTEILQVRSIGA
jgi:hypothetical protein